MRQIAVLSGKGGTGKTFVSVNLSAACPGTVYVDCDVEEPNGRLFYRPEQVKATTVCTKVPVFDETRCTGCRSCINFCRFHALVYIRNKPRVFPDICHACGGCALVCPSSAIREEDRPVGRLEIGQSRDVPVITGLLNLGEASGGPVIQEALKAGAERAMMMETEAQEPGKPVTMIVDCPPGSSCPVMESITDADYCILVTEGTAFGLHNLRMVYELTRVLGKPCGVVINKTEQPYEPLLDFCRENHVDILMQIPFDPAIAHAVSEGQILTRTDPVWAERFRALLKQIGGRCE